MNSLNPIYEFLRGDRSLADFEDWVYHSPILEDLLGNDRYLELVSLNFNNVEEVYKAKISLVQYIETIVSYRCLCRAVKNIDRKIIGDDESVFTTTFVTRKKQTPWIRLDECIDCKTWWLIATDPTFSDESYFQRISLKEVSNIIDKNEWISHANNRDIFWPTFEWLNRLGFSSLADWQKRNSTPEYENFKQRILRYSFNNVGEIHRSKQCGCYRCHAIFPAESVKDFTDRVLEKERTGVCPFCHYPSLIPDETGIQLDEYLLKGLNSE